MDVRWKLDDRWLWRQPDIEYDVKRMSIASTNNVTFDNVVANNTTVDNCSSDAMRAL
jgi:hypothetical protein